MKYSTVEDFYKAKDNLKFPRKPTHPSSWCKKSDYEYESDYYRALADACEEHESEQDVYKEKRKAYGAAQGQLDADFKEFCISEYMDAGVPREVSDMVYALAYDRGHSSGYSEIYNAMSDYANLANAAFKAGKASL